jgi:hypothetical protein
VDAVVTATNATGSASASSGASGTVTPKHGGATAGRRDVHRSRRVR